MALHSDFATMAVECVDEYIETAANCLKSRKPDGGCFGYPATLLLFCVINILGVFLRGETIKIEKREQTITKGEPFRVLNHSIFGLNLNAKRIKILEQSYRNALAHEGIIEWGAFLVQTPNGQSRQNPFTFATDKVQVIDVDSLHQLVVKAWNQFDKGRIQTWARQRRKK